MKIQMVQIDMEAFGAEFTNLNDNEQALFFKGLADELLCLESTYLAQLQFQGVARLLTKDQKELLAETVGMVWYKEEV